MRGSGLELRHSGVIRLAECTYPEAARLARDERAVVILSPAEEIRRELAGTERP